MSTWLMKYRIFVSRCVVRIATNNDFWNSMAVVSNGQVEERFGVEYRHGGIEHDHPRVTIDGLD